MSRRKDYNSHTRMELTASSPLPSPLPSPSPSISPSLSRSSSALSIPALSASVTPQESCSPSPAPSHLNSPRESTKLPFNCSRNGEDQFDRHARNLSEVLFEEFSVEKFRSETPHHDIDGVPMRSKFSVNFEKDVKPELSYKHVQYMLDDNQKLSEEVTNLKTKLNHLNGEHVGLAYQYQQLEAKLQAKTAEVIQLEGKLSASMVQCKSQSEAKVEVQAKLALAESTIESLNRQIAVMAKSDYNARLRENYEGMLTKLRNQHEAEAFVLRGENEGLKYELESRQTEMDSLKAQLLEKEKLLASWESDKLSNVNDLKKKYEEILRETCNKVEYESIIQKKNEEIESLLRENANLRASNSSNQSTRSFSESCRCSKKSLSQEESEYVKELKEEFEKCLVNLQTRRNQVTSLQSQLTSMKKENLELKERLKEAQRSGENNSNDLLKALSEPRIAEIEARYAAQYEKNLQEAIRLMDKTQREEMEKSFRERLERYIDRLLHNMQNDHPLDSYDFDNVFAPLRKLWTAIECNLEERLKELETKQQSMQEAKDNLEKALILSRSIDTSTSQSSMINAKLEKMEEDGKQMILKLQKYKKNYYRLQEKHEREIEKLKVHFASVVAEREDEYRRREEQLIEELSDNPLARCHKLYSYINSPKDDHHHHHC